MGGLGGSGKKSGHGRAGFVQKKNRLALVADVHVDRGPGLQGHEVEAQQIANGLGRRAAELGEDLGLGGAGPGQLVQGIFGPTHPGDHRAVGQSHRDPGLGRTVADDVARRRILGQAAQGLHHGRLAGVVGAGQNIEPGREGKLGGGMGHEIGQGQAGDHDKALRRKTPRACRTISGQGATLRLAQYGGPGKSKGGAFNGPRPARPPASRRPGAGPGKRLQPWLRWS